MDYQFQKETFNSRVGLASEQLNYVKAQSSYLKLQSEHQAVLNVYIGQEKLADTLAKWQSWHNLVADGKLKYAQLRSMMISDMKTQAEIRGINSEISLRAKQGEKIDSEITGIKEDNKGKEFNNKLIESTIDSTIKSMNAQQYWNSDVYYHKRRIQRGYLLCSTLLVQSRVATNPSSSPMVRCLSSFVSATPTMTSSAISVPKSSTSVAALPSASSVVPSMG